MYVAGARHIFTACKRSLGQGNIFRSVCQEFCPSEGGGIAWSGGVSALGGGEGVSAPGGGVSPGTATAAGGTHPTGMNSCTRI